MTDIECDGPEVKFSISGSESDLESTHSRHGSTDEFPDGPLLSPNDRNEEQRNHVLSFMEEGVGTAGSLPKFNNKSTKKSTVSRWIDQISLIQYNKWVVSLC